MKNLINEAIDEWVSSGEFKYTNATHYLKKRLSNLWISVNDSLPAEKRVVLLLDDGEYGVGFVCGYILSTGEPVWAVKDHSDRAHHVTHWMPLPQKPESEGS